MDLGARKLHLSRLRPGDLLGFAACDPTGSAIRVCTGQWICWGGISHVAIVTRWPGIRRLVLAESTSLADEPCLAHGEVVSGVQIHHIRQRILAYHGRVYHFSMRAPARLWQIVRLAEFIRDHLDVPYDYFGAANARGTLGGILVQRLAGEDLEKVFCSEFVAAAHRQIGVLPGVNASSFSPNRLIRYERRRGILGKGVRLK